jgi:hypothetical protein
MLPKPYTEELLVTTTINSLDTGTRVVAWQEQGTAVPEVIEELGESDLSGQFSSFTIREVLDFLNNARRTGVLEVETGHNRYWICVRNGRVQGITATGVEVSSITDRLPDTLTELAPVLKLTVRGTEVEGLVDLLNTKVLDPRLLRRLLRHQAAVLLSTCFTLPLKAFRFDSKRRFPPIYESLSLDVSVLALLVEGAMTIDEREMSVMTPEKIYERRPIRGQNLDRAGLSAHHAKILGRLTSPKTVAELTSDLNWDKRELQRVLYGLELADLVTPKGTVNELNDVVLFESDSAVAERLNESLSSSRDYRFQVVCDKVAVRLLLKRRKVAAMIVDCSDPGFAVELRQELSDRAVYWIGSGEFGTETFDDVLERPFNGPAVISALNALFLEATQSNREFPDVEAASFHERINALTNAQKEPSPCP